MTSELVFDWIVECLNYACCVNGYQINVSISDVNFRSVLLCYIVKTFEPESPICVPHSGTYDLQYSFLITTDKDKQFLVSCEET